MNYTIMHTISSYDTYRDRSLIKDQGGAGGKLGGLPKQFMVRRGGLSKLFVVIINILG
jgi:hypothetical protein